MAALFKEAEKNNNIPRCMRKITIWYWASVFSNAYEGSIDTRMATDFREVKNWFYDDEKVPEKVNEARNSLKDPEWTIRQVDRASNSIYKGVMCLVAIEGQKDFKSGNTPDLNLVDDHHIFPKSKAAKYNANLIINSVLNRTLIAGSTNKEISNIEPAKYLDKFTKEQKNSDVEMAQRLKTHLISKEAFEKMLYDDFNGFLTEREKSIKEKIKELLF